MPSRRQQLLLFALSFITFAWFHQGGGWNQNARFAEVRAIVEEGRLAVDDFLVYRPGEGRKLVRSRVERGEFVHEGKRCQLSWGDWQNVGTKEKPDWQQLTVNGKAFDPDATMVIIGEGTCTGDIGIAPDGHFHPNKPPGASLLAVPAYFVIHHAEKLLGLDPDDWWVMNVNAWLCSVLTVGIASALGVVLVLRLASQMFPGHPGAALGAALAFGFGTTFFPFGTLMFDHNVTAVLLLASFAAARERRPVTAGIWSGIAAVTNYLAAIPGAFFALWVLLREEGRRAGWRAAVMFSLGVLPCLLALLAYNVAAFGSPFALNTSFQNPAFKEIAPAFLGMFTVPSWFAALAITVSPWRGVFVLSPVLVAAAVWVFRGGRAEMPRAERRLIVACAAYFFLINICFNGFHGGFSAGPRYLIPALPFLCLALVPAFVNWPRTTVAMAAVSIVQQSLLTVTDALNPLGVGSHVWVNHPGEWKEKLAGNSLVWRYAWPMFAQGRAWPVIDAKFEEWLGGRRLELEKNGLSAADVSAEMEKLKREAWEKVMRGESNPLWIAAMSGPVSTNALGPWDGTFFQQFPAHSPAVEWSAFNVGEFLFPASRWSLAPLLGLWIAGAFALRRSLRQP